MQAQNKSNVKKASKSKNLHLSHYEENHLK